MSGGQGTVPVTLVGGTRMTANDIRIATIEFNHCERTFQKVRDIPKLDEFLLGWCLAKKLNIEEYKAIQAKLDEDAKVVEIIMQLARETAELAGIDAKDYTLEENIVGDIALTIKGQRPLILRRDSSRTVLENQLWNYLN